MDFFARAHVTREDYSKSKDKSIKRKQLKNMLNAYKEGNNEAIKNIAETIQKHDIDDLKSMSDYSDFSFHREDNTAEGTMSSHVSDEPQTSTDQNSSSTGEFSTTKSNITESEDESIEDSLENVSELEDSKSVSSEITGISTSAKDLSLFDNSSIISGGFSDDSDDSIPTSLITSGSDEEQFDADGALANKILKKLGKEQVSNKKRKLPTPETNKVTKPLKNAKKQKDEKNERKIVKGKDKKKNELGEQIFEIYHDTPSEAFTVLDTKSDSGLQTFREVVSKKSGNKYVELSDHSESTSNSSSPYISITATDMQSQLLRDVIGDYVHPTVKNLPSEKLNIVLSNSTSFLDNISIENLEDDAGSLIPELDEELALDDLNLEEDTVPVDETTTFDDTLQTDNITELELSQEILDETYRHIKFYPGKHMYIALMKHPAELFIHGKVTLTALAGKTEVFGYTLQDDCIDIFAPYCYHAHTLKTVPNEDNDPFQNLYGQLTSAGLTISDIAEIRGTICQNDSVISFSKLDNQKLDYVENYFSKTDLFSKRVDHTSKCMKSIAEDLGCTLYLEKPKRYFDEKSQWDQVVRAGMAGNETKGIVCGGKGTGKSTFLRYYVNRLLAHGPVVVIDLDPGQAEFTVPGNISVCTVDEPLIGPNFTHLRKPEKMLNTGMIDTMDNPARYLSAVSHLINYCRSTEKFRNLPWIVNTMGMCNNMGLKFLAYIILQLQPTFLYQIDSKIVKKRFEVELHSQTIKKLHAENMQEGLFRNARAPNNLEYEFFMTSRREESALPHTWNSGFALTPKEERYLNVLAYFGELLNIHRKGLLEIVPYEVDIRDLSIGMNVRIPQGSVTQVINGKIVALCQLTAADKGNKMFTLSKRSLLCHGHGLIRGVNFEKGILYILTPESPYNLKLVNALVYADWMPELSGQEKDLPSGIKVPYRTANVQQSKLMFPPRRRFNPLQLLKVTRNT